jgi:hypothetical protein
MNPAFLLLPKRQPQPAVRLDRRIQPVATCLRIGTPDLSGRSPPVAASCRMNPAFRVSAHVNLVQMSGCSPDFMLSAKKVARDAPPIQSSCTGGRDGRVVEGTRLESVHTPKGYRGFESLSLRHKISGFCAASGGNAARRFRSADFQVGCVAGFQIRAAGESGHAADLEIGDTAGLETCATAAN